MKRASMLTFFSVIAGAYVLFALLLYLKQDSIVYYPSRNVEVSPTVLGLDYEELWLESDGQKAHAWFIPAAAKDAPAVLFCHGNAGNISHRLSTIQIIHELGMNLLLFDYRGYGRSEGRPSEQNTYADARAAWDYLVQARKIAPARIIVWGRSLGGAVAAWLAHVVGEKETPGALIVESSFSSVPDMGARMYPFMPVRLLSKYSYDTRAYVRKTNCPVLVAHSPDDELTPYEFGREIYTAARQPKRFLEMTGGHNEGFEESGAQYTEGVASFIRDALAGDV